MPGGVTDTSSFATAPSGWTDVAGGDKARGGTVNTMLLKKRFAELRQERNNIGQIWDALDHYIAPLSTLGLPYTQVVETMVQWNRFELWDTRAVDASQKLAAHIHSNLTSPASPWFKLQWRNEKLKKDPKAASWLEKCGEILFEELCDSDFTPEIQCYYQDLVRAGTACIVEEPLSDTDEWKGLDFTAVPLREVFYEEDARGGVYRWYRLLSWSPVQILDKFGDETPKDIKEMVETEADALKRLEIVFCVFQRKEAQKKLEERRLANRARRKMHAENEERRKRNAKTLFEAQRQQLQNGIPKLEDEVQVSPEEPYYPLAIEERPIGGVFFRYENGQPIGKEFGYYEMPVMVGRWERTTGSRWGHGPGMIALPTTKYLNAWMETSKGAAEKVVDPCWGVTELGLMSDLDLSPGGMSVLRSKEDIWILESGADFKEADKTMEELRAQIDRTFHVDDLKIKDSPQMTAAEVQARYEQMQKILGSPVNRIEVDALAPTIKIGLGHCLREGRFPEMPDVVRQAFKEEGANFSIEYLGPLARSQRVDKVAAIERLLAFCASLLKMGWSLELVLAVIDFPNAIRAMAEYLGTPADLIKAEEEVKKALVQLAAEIQAQKQAMLDKTRGEAAQAHANAHAALNPQPNASAGAGPPRPVPPVAPTAQQPGPLVAPSYDVTPPFAQERPQPQ